MHGEFNFPKYFGLNDYAKTKIQEHKIQLKNGYVLYPKKINNMNHKSIVDAFMGESIDSASKISISKEILMTDNEKFFESSRRNTTSSYKYVVDKIPVNINNYILIRCHACLKPLNMSAQEHSEYEQKKIQNRKYWYMTYFDELVRNNTCNADYIQGLTGYYNHFWICSDCWKPQNNHNNYELPFSQYLKLITNSSNLKINKRTFINFNKDNKVNFRFNSV